MVLHLVIFQACKLGPVLTSIVEVEGEPVEALLDTGPPVTIISLA